MTRAIIENKKIVGYEEIKEKQIKHTPEEYAKRIEGVLKVKKRKENA